MGNSRSEEECLIRFYKIVLGWDLSRLQQDSQEKNGGGDCDLCLKEVKDKYSDVGDYLSTFEPLFFEEVKAAIVQGVCKGKEISLGVLKGFDESQGFYFLDVIVIHGETTASHNDLVILSKGKFEPETKNATFAFAFVEHRQAGSLRLRVFLHGEVKGTNVDEVKISTRLARFRSLFNEEACKLHILKVCSLSTFIREFVGLHSITSLPTRELILKAAHCDAESIDRSRKIPQKLMQYIESSHNSSQIEAILAGLSRKPFVLIQGPPRTGKTQTILGLLSALIHSSPARMHTNKLKLHMKQWSELAIRNIRRHRSLSSPWLSGINKRDELMPVDGNDGFFPITGSELNPEVVVISRKNRVRVLVCAPSNSALDEIVLRVINRGIHDENDQVYNPKIVRIGLKAHHSVQSVSMDYLVEKKLASIGDYLNLDKQKQGASAVDRDSIQASILDEAVIVFSTLSFSGSNIFSKMNRTFDAVIIDEAAQAVESATLIPLSSGCKQVFLVGDPVQLPATVLSPIAKELGYGMSLFKRLQQADYPVVMLKTQYRMHPEISCFPSKLFYNGALEDGADIEEKTTRPWHDYRCYGPFCFFNIHESKESQHTGNGSWGNADEVNFVILLHTNLVSRHPELKSSSMLAIISPYTYQVELFREGFRKIYGDKFEKYVDIGTVDGFQGREKDVVIFSCVRSNKAQTIGFLSDFRRMNVGITRARSSVLVVGSALTLEKDPHWSELVKFAKDEQRDSLFEVTKPYDLFFSNDKMKSMQVKKDLGEGENTGFLVVDYGDPDEPDVGQPEYADDDDMGGVDDD